MINDLSVVIPANAGIHFDLARCAFTETIKAKIKMDSSLRWNDGVGYDGFGNDGFGCS
ncbi:MAG: hypothetical protein ACREO0_06775 [Pseudoxanthomonas sp.]